MYDYVIVGAGSAGCVLAARLAEDLDVRVALIDAGPPDTEPAIHVPLELEQLWQSRSTGGSSRSPSRASAASAATSRAGACSAAPARSTRCCTSAETGRTTTAGFELGFAGWGYAEVLPYFKRSEDNECGASEYHGAGGPLAVSDGRSRHPYAAAMIEASVQAGIAPTDDHNGAVQEGAGWFQVTQRDGRRASTAVAYLRPALGGGNIEVLTEAHATRILFEGAARRRRRGAARRQRSRRSAPSAR